MSDEKKKCVRLNAEDTMIGKSLSKVKINHAPAESCPDAEHLAAFVDGVLASDEHQRVVSHIAACNECYELFRETMALKEHMEQSDAKEAASDPPQSRQVQFSWANRRRTRFIPYAAAAAVLLIIFGRLAFYSLAPELPINEPIAQVSPEKVPEIAQKVPDISDKKYLITPQIARNVLAKVAAKQKIEKFQIDDLQSSAFAFDSSISHEVAAFKAGVIVTRVEEALYSKDAEMGAVYLRHLAALAKRDPAGGILSASAARYAQNFEKKKPFSSLDELWRQSEEIFGGSKGSAYYMFGQWLEIGLIAIKADMPELLKASDAELFQKTVSSDIVPKAAINALVDINEILHQTGLSQKDKEKLKKGFQTIIEVML